MHKQTDGGASKGTSIPNLKLHNLVIDGDVPDLEIHTDGADEGLLKHVVLHARKPSASEDRDAATSHLDAKGGTVNLRSREDLPTPLSPTSKILNK